MTDPLDTAAIRERLEAATPGPWFHNGYSWIGSEPLNKTYDAWIDPLVDADHTLERTGDCPPCGKWRDPAACHNWPAGHGCRHHSEDYDRDPAVAHVPSHHGDTAVRRHAADMEFIAHAPGDIRALLARVAELEAEQQNGEWQYGFVNPNTGEFIHHGDENQARALATIVKRPIMRRHATYGPVTPISDTTVDE